MKAHLDSKSPAVTVVIPTRDTGSSVVRTVWDVLASDYADFSIIVVDQSRDDSTEGAMRPFADDPRVRCLRSDARGISRALNLGVDHATADLVAITGDDCEVPADWLRSMVVPLQEDPRIGIVFGNILSGPHDESAGFVPGYVRSIEAAADSLRDKHRIGGTSACMALRRSLWRELRGFDPMLGVGARFHSAEDTDLTLRALAAGHRVLETPKAHVVHHGFYGWDRHRVLVHRYWRGTGAAFAKSLKRRPWTTLPVLFRLAAGWVQSRSRVARSFGGHSLRLRGTIAFLRGLFAGLLTPLDLDRHHYRQGGPRRPPLAETGEVTGD